MATLKCKICGKEENPANWINEGELVKHQMCFTCNFWREKLELNKERGEHKWAMINGAHYYLHPHVDSDFKGFGGRKFRIRFNDGFEIECDNLWHQGEPEHPYWKDQFPNNAIFVNENF